MDLSEKIVGDRNERGIPSSVFVENVEQFLSSLSLSSIEPLIGAHQQLYSKYKFMEANLLKSKNNFKNRIPDIQQDIKMLNHLMGQEKDEQLMTQFSLADNVFANAKVDTSEKRVCIWLGANVMVEYSYEEAEQLLHQNLKNAQERLRIINEDLLFLRDNIITSEVNIARIFNYDVRRKRLERDEKLVEQ